MRCSKIAGCMLGMLLGSLLAVGVASGQPATEDFETGYTLGADVGDHADWFDGAATDGSDVTAGIGVASSIGLGPGARIFTWTAHPFDWNALNFLSVELQMDFQTSTTGQFDDDRMGWMITDTDTESSNIFGVQLDHADGGIVTYWRDSGDVRIQDQIVDISGLPASTWFRFWARITKLTSTSARIEVSLVELDASGNPTGTPYTGTVNDTSTWPGGAPAAGYFTATTIWPAYKNFQSANGAADNAYAEVFTGTLPEYTLTVGTVGNGSVTLDPPGGLYLQGTVVELTADADPGHTLDAWSGDLTGSDNPAYITMTADMNVTATFVPIPQYTLTVNVDGNGTVTLDPPGGTYDLGTEVELTPEPDPDHIFDSWSGDLTGSDNPATITMTANMTVTATFVPIPQYTLTVDITGNGVVTLDPPGGLYDAGTEVQLTADADPDWIFYEWQGAVSGSINPATVVMDGNKAVAAYFTQGSELQYCEDFETGFTLDAQLRDHADWFYEAAASGPTVQAGVGVAGSIGLSNGDRAFTWVAHPFTWTDTDVQSVWFQMDYQTSGSGQLDDDRLGWTISDVDDSSDWIFGVQMDPGGGGAGGNIECYWDGDAFGDNGGRTSIADLPALTANGWYRLRADFTKLTDGSARIDVSLIELDSGGNEVSTVVTGSLLDTALVPGTAGEEIPNPAYFSASTMWPVYKNYQAVAGAVDNPCFGIISADVTAVQPEVPREVAVLGNYPNPFNPSTQIRFAIPVAGPVELVIYDVLGRRVVDLVNDEYTAGEHEVTWTGRDSRGRAVPTGAYFYVLRSGNAVDRGKMTMIK